MSFRDGFPLNHYPTTIEFSVAQLVSIQPSEVAAYMRLCAYGTATPGPNDRPTHCRSSTLEVVKKAISFFVPNKSPWIIQADGVSGVGNPSRSTDVNQVIKQVELAEVRKQGRASNAKRDMKRAEFRKTLRLLEARCVATNHFDLASRLTAMMKLQFHIIGRTDDICNIETADLRGHSKFPDTALQMKVSWSKNVRDERSCPDQLLLGANDTDFCVLLALACYLESTLTEGKNEVFLFCDDNEVDRPLPNGETQRVQVGPDRLNDRYRRTLHTIWTKNPDMLALLRITGGALGTHSLRKFPSTWCTEHGYDDDKVEIRGRWKGKKGGRVVHRYISPEQLPTDAKMAACLAVGGPVRYKVKADAHVTAAFMADIVCPSITQFYSDESNRIAHVLGPVLLWAAHNPDMSHLLTDTVRNRIRNGYAAIRQQHPADYNPVDKVPLHVYQVANQVHIAELTEQEQHQAANAPPQDQAGDNGVGLRTAAAAAASRDNMVTMQLQLNNVQRTLAQHQQQTNVSTLTANLLLTLLFMSNFLCSIPSLCYRVTSIS